MHSLLCVFISQYTVIRSILCLWVKLKWGRGTSPKLHRVSKKLCKFVSDEVLTQNFVKCPSILITFGRKMAKRLKLCDIHSLSTLANSCHHTTVSDKNKLGQFFETRCSLGLAPLPHFSFTHTDKIDLIIVL